MAKYIKNYLTVSAATEATDILSPNVTYIQDREKLLMADMGDNKELKIEVDGKGDVIIRKVRDYLTFTCIEAGGISLTNYGDNEPNIEYSLNGGEWTTWDYSNISLTTGNVVKMRGVNSNGFSYNASKYSCFVMSGAINASGNIMSLIDGKRDGVMTIPSVPSCFCRLFKGCTSLKTCCELPATTLYGGCYFSLFMQTGIIDASNLILPAKVATFATSSDIGLSSNTGCYRQMFYGCSSLTTAPELPATTLATYCYQYMFSGCSSLTTAPELPATTLATYCYQYMFQGCSSLTSMSKLPATTLADSCYEFMFKGCSSLTTAPELPATNLVERCYDSMFYGCSSLNYIKCLATSELGGFTASWVDGVSATGTFVKAPLAIWPTGDFGIPYGWTVKNLPGVFIDNTFIKLTDEQFTKTYAELGYSAVYDNNVKWQGQDSSLYNVSNRQPVDGEYVYTMTFTCQEDGGVSLSNVETKKIYYSKNNAKISTWDGTNISLVSGDTMVLCGNNPSGLSTGNTAYSQFTMTGKIAASGNTNALLSPFNEITTIPCSYCFYNLFNGCSSLTSAPELPATSLAEWCYYQMFKNCWLLTTAPELPATTLVDFCYGNMFYACTSLTTAPELPATTLATGCYYEMFEDCYSLNYIKCLATSGQGNETFIWANGVSATGTFVKAASATWPKGVSGIPSGWTVIDA